MQVTRTSRRLAIYGAMLAAAVVPATAFAGGSGGEEKGGRHGHGGGSGTSVTGRAMSRGEKAMYGLELRAHKSDDPDAKSFGIVRFGQRTEEGWMGLEGYISCLSRDDSGIVQLSGTVRRMKAHNHDHNKGGDDGGQQAQPSDDPQTFLDGILGAFDQGGETQPAGMGKGKDGEKSGKDFAFTIDVPGDPQHFSAPALADTGTLPACSAGEGSFEVSRGGFQTTRTEGTRGRHGH